MNIQIRRCSTSLFTRKMQIKSIIQCNLILIRTATIKKKKVQHTGKDAEPLPFAHIAVRVWNVTNTVENCLVLIILIKLDNLPYDPVIPLLIYSWPPNENMCSTKNYKHILLIIISTWEPFIYPSAGKMVKLYGIFIQ